MLLKFVQQVPQTVQGISDNQGEGKACAQQAYGDKHHQTAVSSRHAVATPK